MPNLFIAVIGRIGAFTPTFQTLVAFHTVSRGKQGAEPRELAISEFPDLARRRLLGSQS